MTRTSIVSDRLTIYGGAERVLLEMVRLLGVTDLHAIFHTVPVGPGTPYAGLMVRPTFLQKAPLLGRFSKFLLPFEPFAVEQIELAGNDLVVSSSHAVAKGCLTGPDQCHVSMVYSPMRYAWDLQGQYLTEMRAARGFKSFLIRRMLHRLRTWDVISAQRPDSLIAISNFIAARIWKCWGRQSKIIYPPVDTMSVRLDSAPRDDYYITASRMVPYKRFDLIIEAFRRMPQRKLVVIGDGVDLPRVRRIAEGAGNIELLGFQPTEVLRSRVARAKAFVFAAVEDFGIAPLEAQAAGTPVIALGVGGSRETIRDGETGVLFPEQTAESLISAVEYFEENHSRFAPERCRLNAERFSYSRFGREFLAHIDLCLDHHRRCLAAGRFTEPRLNDQGILSSTTGREPV